MSHIKYMLPKGWCSKLAELTGKSRDYCWRVVNNQDISSEIWGNVVEMADKEHERLKENNDKTIQVLKKRQKPLIISSKKKLQL